MTEQVQKVDTYTLWRTEALQNMKGVFGDDIEGWFCTYERDMKSMPFPEGRRSFVMRIEELLDIARQVNTTSK